jgi:hypothetical protein
VNSHLRRTAAGLLAVWIVWCAVTVPGDIGTDYEGSHFKFSFSKFKENGFNADSWEQFFQQGSDVCILQIQ